MRGFKRAALLLAAASTAVFATFGVASAGPPNALGKSTGSVGFVDKYNNAQYISFSAFDYGLTGDKGSVAYTNFSVAQPGTGIWVPGDFRMGFAVGIDPTIQATYAQHTTALVPLGLTSVGFQGTGSVTGWNSSFTGTISGSAFNMQMTEINAADATDTYQLIATGTVDLVTGAVTGTWSDNYNTGRTGTFVIADVGYEAFHYANAPVISAAVGTPFTFTYRIPTGPAAGLAIPVAVTDLSTPAVPLDQLVLNGLQETLLSGNLNVF